MLVFSSFFTKYIWTCLSFFNRQVWPIRKSLNRGLLVDLKANSTNAVIQKSKKAKLELKERRNVTSRYHGSKISGIRSNDDGDGNENGKIAQGFLIYQQNNKIPRASRFFVHFLAVDCDMKLPNFMCPLGYVNKTQKCSFFWKV